MRNTYIGLAVAAAIIAALFLISRLVPHATPAAAPQQAEQGPDPQQIAAAASQVGPGFTGDAQIGLWSLKCGPVVPPKPDASSGTLDASQSPPANPKPAGLDVGRCRAAIVVRPRDNPKTVAMVAVVRLVEDKTKDRVLFILHVPPVLKPGNKVVVALTEKEVVGIPVLNCEKGQCVALGVLESQVYHAIFTRSRVAVIVPVQAKGQRMVIPLMMSGLMEAVEAMKRAG